MARAALPGRLNWQLGRVIELTEETARTKSISFALPDWAGHRAGQHYVVRLTAPDGYTAARSYSVASAPDGTPELQCSACPLAYRVDDGIPVLLVDEARTRTDV